MTEQDAVRYACLIQALVTQSIGDYTDANDGFCVKCPYHGEEFRSSGLSLRYMRAAVSAQLIRDGHTLEPGCINELDALEKVFV